MPSLEPIPLRPANVRVMQLMARGCARHVAVRLPHRFVAPGTAVAFVPATVVPTVLVIAVSASSVTLQAGAVRPPVALTKSAPMAVVCVPMAAQSVTESAVMPVPPVRVVRVSLAVARAKSASAMAPM